MAFDSSSTLQQTDEVAAVASGGSVGGGGGVAANTEIAAFRPGSLFQGALLLSHYARHF